MPQFCLPSILWWEISTRTPEAEGRSIAEYAQLTGKDVWTAFFDLCMENNCSTGGVYSSKPSEKCQGGIQAFRVVMFRV